MSKFDEKLRVLNQASRAESALAWFNVAQSFTVTFSVNGYATEGGKNAMWYFDLAAAELKDQILAKAKELAEIDFNKGDDV
jgi:hypothetical protein